MKGLCISIDVSKGESHVGSFVNPTTVYRKVFVIKHDLKGFQQLKALHDEMKEKFQEEVCIVFEATGVYHRGVQNYLEQNGIINVNINMYKFDQIRMYKWITKPLLKNNLLSGRNCQLYSQYVHDEGFYPESRSL